MRILTVHCIDYTLTKAYPLSAISHISTLFDYRREYGLYMEHLVQKQYLTQKRYKTRHS
jgi:hypothetical protein